MRLSLTFDELSALDDIVEYYTMGYPEGDETPYARRVAAKVRKAYERELQKELDR